MMKNLMILILLLGVMGMAGCAQHKINGDREIEIIMVEETDANGIVSQIVLCVKKEQLNRFNVTKDEVRQASLELADFVFDALLESLFSSVEEGVPEDPSKKKKNDIFMENKGIEGLFTEGFYAEIRELNNESYKIVSRNKFPQFSKVDKQNEKTNSQKRKMR